MNKNCLVLTQQTPLYLLSGGSRLNRLWLGGRCLFISLVFVQRSHITDLSDALLMVPLMFWWF